MKILDDLVSTLEMEAPVRDIRQGVFHTGVWTRDCGLASTLPLDAMRQEVKPPLVKAAGRLAEKKPRELVQMAYSNSILEAATGMAAINSLLRVDASLCRELNARELISEKGAGKRIAIVGHFPFIEKLRKIARTLWVIEKDPQPGDEDESAAEHRIPQAEIVALTGSAFTNHTIENLLELCNPNAYVVLLGDTSPMSTVLFDFGVDAISGTRVVDPELALQCVSEGANFRQIRGTRRLTMMKG